MAPHFHPRSTTASQDDSQKDYSDHKNLGDSDTEGCEAESEDVYDLQPADLSFCGTSIQGHIEKQDAHSSTSRSNGSFGHQLRVILQQLLAGLPTGRMQDGPRVNFTTRDGKLIRSIDTQSPAFHVMIRTASTYLKGNVPSHVANDGKNRVPCFSFEDSLDKRRSKPGRKPICALLSFAGELIPPAVPKDIFPLQLSLKSVSSVRLSGNHTALQSTWQANGCDLQILKFSAQEEGNPLLLIHHDDDIGLRYWLCAFVRDAFELTIITGRAVQPQESDFAHTLRAINADSLADTIVILKRADCPWEQSQLLRPTCWLQSRTTGLYLRRLSSTARSAEPCTVPTTSPGTITEVELAQPLSHHQAPHAACANGTRPSTSSSTVKANKRKAVTPLALVCTKRARHRCDSTPARQVTAEADAARPANIDCANVITQFPALSSSSCARPRRRQSESAE
ncbi:hypothetical protein BCV69DRAFT_301927 [Microstroma glucosiphilum]|uniref:Uncharacterized protein n=1 Tax=Pseudomicrostroma glucosiphilum TaxID=1684307 RepID=A0A316TZE0_9BASI|nr:hypothetical protein BCV69DRAFT_301927 [Pseudomicrostroma glucosiphilum]PWN17691.1 hypothetical protein BCV69DRAFT_301927 [Pseudomicrostroma glucosiphilum]